MPEKDIIQSSVDGPVTTTCLIEDFQHLGVQAGMTLLVHSSLSALGWVSGGAVAVINALEEVLGPEGTLVMPTHSGDLSDPAHWQHPPVPESWWQTIQETMTPFSKDMTPTRGMGSIPECFRKQDGTLRSSHPQVSFAARGPKAEAILGDHSLEYGLGEASPLARLYDLQGHVLLLGVGHDSNTSLHLAEHRANFPGKKIRREGAPILVDGQRAWVGFEDIELMVEDFPVIGEAHEADSTAYQKGAVGYGESILIPQRGMVDFATAWMEDNRA